MKKEDRTEVKWGDIPPVLSSTAVLDKAFKRAARVRKRGRTKVEGLRSESVAKVQALGDTIASSMEGYRESFPSIDNLPGFYRDLLHILVNADSLKKSLGAVDWCRKRVLQFAKAYSREIGRLTDVSLIQVRRKEAYGRISSLVKQVSSSLDILESARTRLSNLPTIDLEAPTIVVAGAANVGKSQFVAASSSAKPKIAQYPFTTKEISVGHTERKWMRIQIIDTPGLLDRTPEERNEIEQQAVNALRYLAKVVVFLLDPTEMCGYSMEAQMHLLERLRKEFPEVRFLEVENKVDIKDSRSGRMKVSALTGRGVSKAIDAATALLTNRAPAASRPREAE